MLICQLRAKDIDKTGIYCTCSLYWLEFASRVHEGHIRAYKTNICYTNMLYWLEFTMCVYEG